MTKFCKKKNALSTTVPVPLAFSLFTLADFLHRLLSQSVTIVGFMPVMLMLEQYHTQIVHRLFNRQYLYGVNGIRVYKHS